MKPLHLAWSDGRSSDCGISYTASPRTTFVAADVTCEACRKRLARRRSALIEAERKAPNEGR